MNELRHDWTRAEVADLFASPLLELLMQAQQVHRRHFDPTRIQASTLLSIKTGACPEDCKYCAQSGRYQTGLDKEKLLPVEQVLEQAKAARAQGASRFCMGAAWRSPSERDMPAVLEMVQQVKALGLETCMTLGMLDASQATRLAAAGLDYYNHNLDTSSTYYTQVISSHRYEDRLQTLEHVRDAGIKVCAGGIVGMGEERQDRVDLLLQLANLPQHPASVPINRLVPIPGTPLSDVESIDELEFVRCIAVARILMPASYVRLSAGRESMSASTQALCYMAGANSIFLGCKLLTTGNQEPDADRQLLARLGLRLEEAHPPLYHDAMARPHAIPVSAS